MNADRLLALFEEISEAPDAIPRLRRFILDLAVRGKLVEQDPEDEPAEVLLARITKESRIAGSAKRAIPEIQKGISSDWLPESWCPVPLIAIGRWAVGSGFPKNEQGNESGQYFFLKVSDMNLPGNEKYITTTNNFIDDATAARLKAKIHPPGTIIFPKIGGAIATNKRGILARASAIDNNCLGIIFSKELFNEWVYLLMLSLDFTKYQAGTAVPALQQGVLGNISVALPPLAEQHRIVAKVDELMALCDQLEAARLQREQCRERLVAASLQRLNQPNHDTEAFRSDARFALQVLPSFTSPPGQIKQLRQTILNLAVRGMLVEQDPEDEPVEDLLTHFAEAKLERKRLTGDARIKIEQDPSPDSLPMSLPESWECQSFQNLFLFKDYRGNTPLKTSEGIPLITAKNIRMGYLDREPREYVSPKTYEGWMTRGLPCLGDLFFTMEAPLGNVSINPIEEPFALAQRVVCLQPYGEIDTRFVMYALMSDSMQEMIGEQATGLTAKGIKAAKLKPLPIPLPPLAEQHRIVAKVDEQMALCDQLEQQLSQAEQSRRGVLEAVLREALEGEIAQATSST